MHKDIEKNALYNNISYFLLRILKGKMNYIIKNMLKDSILLILICKIFAHGMDISQACARGNLARVRELIAQKKDRVNQPNHHGYTPLYWTAYNNDLELLQALLEAGANINQPNNDDDGWAPLHRAAYEGYLEFVQELIKKGADVNQQTNDGGCALGKAAYRGHIEVVQTLITANANVNLQDKHGKTPIMSASAEFDHPKVAQILLNAGADVNHRDSSGWTALHVSAMWGYYETIQVLLTAGADANQQDSHGKTPLTIAATHNHKEIAGLITRVNEAHAIARINMLTLMSAIQTRLGTESPARLLTDTQRNGLAHFLGLWIRQAAIEYAVYQS